MNRFVMFIPLLLLAVAVSAQNQKYLTISMYTTQTDLPFGKFARMFSGVFHPGIEVARGINFREKEKHDWFWDARVSYFYHRFVQHGILFYSNIGYRYKFSQRFSADAAIGGGYMESIPATAKLKLNSNGDYENNKGAGRAQAIIAVGIGAGYTIHHSSLKPIKLFINYQQRIQLPFVKSYVPLLPYNSFMFGISKPLNAK